MELNEFKDKLFDALNDTSSLPIQDIVVEDAEDKINIYLTDGTKFIVRCEYSGEWWILGR